MQNYNKAINRVLESIDWRKIKSYHAKLGIRWEYKVDKEIVYKTPSIPELRSELNSIFQHMVEENLDYISYGSWVIFWDRESTGDVRVIFRLADFSFEDSQSAEMTTSPEELKIALEKALQSENYEYAAQLRDEINNRNNNANNNIQ
jgi:hypothetical protein